MKRNIATIAVLLLAAWAVEAATTVDVKRLGIDEQAAHLGANLVVEVEYSDFSTTATNTAETLTLDIAAGQGFCVLYAQTEVEFANSASSATNWTDSLALTVGNTDVDQYLASMQLATESTEVSGKFGTGLADGEFYEAADTVDFIFTPNAENATSDFTSGKVSIYCKMID